MAATPRSRNPAWRRTLNAAEARQLRQRRCIASVRRGQARPTTAWRCPSPTSTIKPGTSEPPMANNPDHRGDVPKSTIAPRRELQAFAMDERDEVPERRRPLPVRLYATPGSSHRNTVTRAEPLRRQEAACRSGPRPSRACRYTGRRCANAACRHPKPRWPRRSHPAPVRRGWRTPG